MRILLFFILCFAQILMNAQDTIYKRTGEIFSVKVIEVNIKEISYKRTELPDGPLFVTNKNEIKKIKYFTGAVDSFSIAKKEVQKPVYQFTQVYQPNPRTAFVVSDKIYSDLKRGKYIYKGRTISDRNVLFMTYKKNLVWNNKEITSNIKDSRRNKKLQYAIGYGGAAIGAIGLLGAISTIDGTTNNDDSAVTAIVALASAGIFVSSQIVSFTYKLKRIKNADQVTELYNQYFID